jgi:ribosome-binding protein aMBF1 (putative translation factor)
MTRFDVKDSEGTDLLQFFAKLREDYSQEELTRYYVSGAVFQTSVFVHMRRNYLGWTQEELANKCDYKIRTISALENNEMMPTFDRVVRVLYELGYEFEIKERSKSS